MKMGTGFWVGARGGRQTSRGPGESVYAKQLGISVTALYYWQRKLKATPEMGESGQLNKFVALRVVAAVVAQSSPNCTLVIPSGMRLEMSALPAPDWLAALGRIA